LKKIHVGNPLRAGVWKIFALFDPDECWNVLEAAGYASD
jgi:hypothetical protein